MTIIVVSDELLAQYIAAIVEKQLQKSQFFHDQKSH